MAGLYLHIPFCRQACSYCDFYFTTRQDLREPFVDALLNEIGYRAETGFPGAALRTVYFGGGTPSRLPAGSVGRLLDAVRELMAPGPFEEVTLEANPDDITPAALSEWKAAGVTRLSLGVQSFDAELLGFMHRAHDARQAVEAITRVKEAGFASYTVDLIYGNPGQTDAVLERDLETLLALEPPHVSAYALTVEPRTRLGRAVEAGRLKAPDDTVAARHMERAATVLAGAGLARYEVSNFARPGHEALHNARYWKHVPYLGLGPGAHSFDGRRRWENARDLHAYLASAGVGIASVPEHLSDSQLAEERLLMGFRTREGITRTELADRYGYRFSPSAQAALDRFRTEGWLEDDGDRIRLLPAGFALADALVLRLV